MTSSLGVGSFRGVGLPGDLLTARCVFRGLRGPCLATLRWGTEVPLRPSHACVLRVRRRVSLPPGSWPSAFHRVLRRTAPPPTRCRCPLPRTEVRFGATLPHVTHVPPSWFLTTLTACSTYRSTGLLHPAAGHGVHRVADPRHSCRFAVPRCLTLQSIPLPGQLLPRHRGTMPPCPCATCVRPRGTSRRSSDRESVVTTRRHRLAALVALLGFPLWCRACPKARTSSHVPSPVGPPEGSPPGPTDDSPPLPKERWSVCREARPPRNPPAEGDSAPRACARAVVRRLRRAWAGR